MYGNPQPKGFRTVGQSDTVCRAGFCTWMSRRTRSSEACRESPVSRYRAAAASDRHASLLWRISRAPRPQRSRFVFLCYKNGPFVSSGQIENPGGGGRGFRTDERGEKFGRPENI